MKPWFNLGDNIYNDLNGNFLQNFINQKTKELEHITEICKKGFTDKNECDCMNLYLNALNSEIYVIKNIWQYIRDKK